MLQDGGECVADGYVHVRGGACPRPGICLSRWPGAPRRVAHTACALPAPWRWATPARRPLTPRDATGCGPHMRVLLTRTSLARARRLQVRRRRGAPPGEAAHDHRAHHTVRPLALPARQAGLRKAASEDTCQAQVGRQAQQAASLHLPRVALPAATQSLWGGALVVAWGGCRGTSQGGRGGLVFPRPAHRPGCLISWLGAPTWALSSLWCRDAGGTSHAGSPGAAVEVLGTRGPQLTRPSTPVAPQARPGAGPPGHAPRQDAGRHHGVDAVHGREAEESQGQGACLPVCEVRLSRVWRGLHEDEVRTLCRIWHSNTDACLLPLSGRRRACSGCGAGATTRCWPTWSSRRRPPPPSTARPSRLACARGR